MTTVSEEMAWYREALRNQGEDPPPGPAVFIEARRDDEVVIARTRGVMKAPVWSTQRMRRDPEEMQRNEQERTQRLMTLQELVAEESSVFAISKTEANASPNVCIGRAPRNDIVIEDGTISSLHADVELAEGAILLRDQGSSNGTFLNARKLGPNEAARLRSGDCVRFGDRVFYFLTGDRLLTFLGLRIVKTRPPEPG